MDAEPALKDCRVLLCQLEISSSTTLVALKLAKKHNGMFIFSYYRPQTKPGGAWLPGGVRLLGGVCGCGGGACMVAGGCVWLWEGCMVVGGVHGYGEGACVVVGGVHGCQGACIGYDEIRSMSGWYASYWNAFLSEFICLTSVTCAKLKEKMEFPT